MIFDNLIGYIFSALLYFCHLQAVYDGLQDFLYLHIYE